MKTFVQLLAWLLLAPLLAYAQPAQVNSGSDGHDGAFNPTAPTIDSPDDHAVRLNQTPYVFDWSTVAGASKYRIYVDNHSGFGSPEINEEPVLSELSSSTSLPDNVYFWKVQAIDSANQPGPWSDVRQFVVDTPPPVPNLLSPANGSAVNQGDSVTLSWSGPSLYSIYRYYIRIVQGTDLNAAPVRPDLEPEPGVTSVEVSSAGWPAGTYTWGVRAMKQAPLDYDQGAYETHVKWGTEYGTRTFTVQAQNGNPDYPGATWIPAADANLNTADRSFSDVRWIVIHTTEGTTDSAVQRFQNPAEQVSAHFVVSRDGSVIQMVHAKDIAFGAGNYAYNQKCINIEHERYGTSDSTELIGVTFANSKIGRGWQLAWRACLWHMVMILCRITD